MDADDDSASPLGTPDAVAPTALTENGEEVAASTIAAPAPLPDSQPPTQVDVHERWAWADVDIDDEEPADNGTDNAPR